MKETCEQQIYEVESSLKDKHRKGLENQSEDLSKDSKKSQKELKKQLARQCQIEKESIELTLKNECLASTVDLETKL